MAVGGGDQERFCAICCRAAARRPDRQASEQWRTSSQVSRHFFRHPNGRPQLWQVLVGRSAFLGGRVIAPKPCGR